MNKTIFLAAAWLLATRCVWANTVDPVTALNVATRFYQSASDNTASQTSPGFTLAHRPELSGRPGVPAFYIFNANDGRGFVIVSGDDVAEPVLGYSDESPFDPQQIPENLAELLHLFQKQIEQAVELQVKAEPAVRARWEQMKQGRAGAESGGVNPLITTKWDQGLFYNALCPGGALTGCVATAMAQIMKFYNYPAQGAGFYSYNENDYGTLSANFGGTTYDWPAMPVSVNGPNHAVATLMYHCGVAANTNYGTEVSTAQVLSALSPQTHCAEYAFKNHFGYAAGIQGVLRYQYTADGWHNMLKDELNAGRPVLYVGFGTGGGHAFVCDGFDNNGLFHMNWGWGGNSDGYFQTDALNPGSLGSGGGNGGFNSNQYALIGIKPESAAPQAVFAMYSNISITPDPIQYGQPVSVNADILNTGNATFFGDITAALFDDQFNFVETVQVLTENNGLPPNYHYTNGNDFVSQALTAAPGNYYIGIFVRPTGGDWVQVSDGTYDNLVPITIVSPNNMQMYAPIQVSVNPLVRNQPASVTLDVANFGAAAFNGSISIDLHGIDGTWIREIDVKNNLNLQVNSHFINGLTYQIAGLDVEPGSYQIAVWAQDDGGNWQLVQASDNFPNPVTVTVTEQALQPDAYENNNVQANAYGLNLNFAGNTANRNTQGSSLHAATDVDFYKLTLPAGYSYTISPRLHDAYNSGNGLVYTVDALWSYSVGNNPWSGVYDDIATDGDITVTGPANVYFQLAAYFPGNTGSYQFDLVIVRTATTATNTPGPEMALTVFPNPACDRIQVTGNGLRELKLVNFAGELIVEQKIADGTSEIPVKDLPEGAYLLMVTGENGVSSRKVVIDH